jgi:hypothetical protein
VELTVDVSTTPPPPQVPVDLPFASFRQEAIPLRQQHKKLPEERQERRQKRAQNPKRRSQPTTKYSPQPTTCRHCNENFSSRNALFRHLKLCKKSRSRASSVASKWSAPSTCRVSRASSVSSSLSSTSLVSSSSNVSRASTTSTASSASSVASIEKVQLKILSQLYAIRSQDLSFLRKNDPLHGSPQNRQLRKTTAASPTKSSATQSTADRPPVEPYTPEAQEPTVDVPEVEPVVSIPVPVESSAPRALESTVDAPGVVPVEPTLLKLSTLELSQSTL